VTENIVGSTFNQSYAVADPGIFNGGRRRTRRRRRRGGRGGKNFEFGALKCRILV